MHYVLHGTTLILVAAKAFGALDITWLMAFTPSILAVGLALVVLLVIVAGLFFTDLKTKR